MDWLTADVLAAAAKNSSDWPQRIAEPGVWVLVVLLLIPELHWSLPGYWH